MTLWSRSSGSITRCIVSNYVCINRYILCCTVGVFSVDTLSRNVIFFRFFSLLLLLLDDDDDIDGKEEQEEEADNDAVMVEGVVEVVVEVARVCSKAKSVFMQLSSFSWKSFRSFSLSSYVPDGIHFHHDLHFYFPNYSLFYF